MRRLAVPALVAAAAILVVPVAVVALDSEEPSDATPAATDDRADDRAEDGEGSGPPPWAHAGGNGHGKALGKMAGKGAWKEAWLALTPEQREQKMQELAQAHERGMRAWAACVEEAGDDRAARADCEKPLPPGLAKKLP